MRIHVYAPRNYKMQMLNLRMACLQRHTTFHPHQDIIQKFAIGLHQHEFQLTEFQHQQKCPLKELLCDEIHMFVPSNVCS